MRSRRVLDPVAELPRLALARTLRAHPEWLLANVFGVIKRGGPRAAALGKLTIGELLDGPCEKPTSIDRARHRRATRCNGAEFDQLVFEVLCEAQDDVASGYLRARLGGPRWKMQKSLRRLHEAGKVVTSGATSATRHRAVRVPT
jgi:hypothetical protein